MGTADREHKIWEFESNKFIVKGYSKYHTARVTCISWSPNSVNLASGAIDGKVFVWDITKKLRKSHYNNVHMYGGVCDMNAIMKIAKDNNLLVLEDCAQCHAG